jgi:hypothetical protein
MNYELCKQLKDAGFPQISENAVSLKSMSEKMDAALNGGDLGYVAIPTLSELIEACVIINPAFTISTTFGPNGWGTDKWECLCLGIDIQYGSTPEEAVARLWLELNK